MSSPRPRSLPCPPHPQPARTSSISAVYNREWDRVARLPVPASWMVSPAVGTCRTAHEVLGRVGGDRSLPADVADDALATLVGLAAHDALAARIVLQRLLAPLVAIARRRAGGGRRARDVLDDLVAQAWIAIRTYPLARRPRKVAANLVRDTEYHVFTRPTRLRSGSEVPAALAGGDAGATDGLGRTTAGISAATEALALLRGAPACGVPARDVELLRRLHLDGTPTEVIAVDLGVTPRTVRNRRTAAYRSLVAAAA